MSRSEFLSAHRNHWFGAPFANPPNPQTSSIVHKLVGGLAVSLRPKTKVLRTDKSFKGPVPYMALMWKRKGPLQISCMVENEHRD